MKRKTVGWSVGIGVLSLGLIAVWNHSTCAYAGWQLKRDTRYAPLLGCLALGDDGKWLPLLQTRDIE